MLLVLFCTPADLILLLEEQSQCLFVCPMHAIHLTSLIPMVMASVVPMEMVHTT